MKILNNFIKKTDNAFYKLAVLYGVCTNQDYCADCPYYRETIGCLVTDYLTRRYEDSSSNGPNFISFSNLVELLELKKDAPSIEELDAMDEDILKAAFEIEPIDDE